MVEGLELFRKHFAPYEGQYVLIGGTACDLAMEEVGQSFRPTKDLDIVLCAEVLDDGFIAAFWDFVKAGGYKTREKSGGGRQLYRFQAPETEGYPFMLELFSRILDSFSFHPDCHLTPIPASEDVSSLSAILLDDEYYAWICEGARIVGGVAIVDAEHLVPLKVRAWLDLSARKEAGEHVDRRNVRKHRNDVFRLLSILEPAPFDSVPKSIVRDMGLFIARMRNVNIGLHDLGLGSLSMDEVLDALGRIYLTDSSL